MVTANQKFKRFANIQTLSFRSGLCETSEEDICDSTFQLVQFNISIYVCMCLYVYVCEGMPELV